MRVAPLPQPPGAASADRRALLHGAVLGVVLGCTPRAARGAVEGIPFYAPAAGDISSGAASGLPRAGFETLLPAVEAMRDDIGRSRELLGRMDWTELGAIDIAGRSNVLGSFAAILGDDAYARYRSEPALPWGTVRPPAGERCQRLLSPPRAAGTPPSS